MITTAIISEYNPFHNGHLFQAEESKKITQCDNIISIMSGNYVQRGEPAIIDKYTRTEIALRQAVDICFEIPLVFCLSSAQDYARGAVFLLDKLGFVNYLSFGSECGDIQALTDIARILHEQPPKYQTYLKSNLKSGMTYAKAVGVALSDYSKEESFFEIMSSPNNILGIEYIKALKEFNSKIIPITIKRLGVNHDCQTPDISSKTASASFIRRNIDNVDVINPYISNNTASIISSYSNFVNLEDFRQIINYLVLTKNTSELEYINGFGGNLPQKINKIKNHTGTVDSLINEIKTKEISYTHISRFLLSMILNIKIDYINTILDSKKPYIKLLGLRKESSAILKNCRENDNIDIITKWADYSPSQELSSVLKTELQANDLYYQIKAQKDKTYAEIEIKKSCIII